MKVALLERCDRPGHPLHANDERWDIVRTLEVSDPPPPDIKVPQMLGPMPLAGDQKSEHEFQFLRYRKRVHAPTHVAIGTDDATFEMFLAYERT
ncbi:MAG TPA: hypothetical protein VIN37_02810 [Candidatus Limnocylindria bacterium]